MLSLSTAAISHRCAGGIIVYQGKQNTMQFLLIKQQYINNLVGWSFPKGHIDSEETAISAARREIEEETGLKTLFGGKSLGIEQYCYWQEGNLHRKWVHWFFFRSYTQKLQLQSEEQIMAASWLNFEAALDKISYVTLAPFLSKAYEIAKKQPLIP